MTTLWSALQRPPRLVVECADGSGVCAAPKHGIVVVLQTYTDATYRLHVHSLLDGTLLRTVGRIGTNTAQYLHSPYSACLSPDGDHMLIVEFNHHRVRQVSLKGGECYTVRYIGVGVLYPEAVDCNANVIAVARHGFKWLQVWLFSWDGNLTSQFRVEESTSLTKGLKLLHNGSGLAIVDVSGNKLYLFSLSGQLVKVILKYCIVAKLCAEVLPG